MADQFLTPHHPRFQTIKRYILCLGVAGVILTLPELTRPKRSFAQSNLETFQPQKVVIKPNITFRPPPDKPHPEKTESGGVRKDALCSTDVGSNTPVSASPRLRAVVPDAVVKYTASGRPIFWITLPQTQAKKIKLGIISSAGVYHSDIEYFVPQSPALIGLRMPDEAPDLEVGQSYQWNILLVCGDTADASDPGLSAFIKRVNPSSSLSPIPPSATLKQRAIWYSQNGFWHDAVSTLIEAHLANPNDAEIQRLWTELLQSVKLDAIAQEYGPAQNNIVIP